MKQFLLYCLLLISSNTVFAQPAGTLQSNLERIKNFPFPKAGTSPVSKTTGLEQRLKSARFYVYTDIDVFDSVQFKYSDARGSAFDFNIMGYRWMDVEHPWIKMDTALMFTMAPGYINLDRIWVRNYDAAGNITSSMDTVQNGYWAAKTLLFYGSAGDITDLFKLNYFSYTGVWDTNAHEFYQYVNYTNGRMVKKTALPYRTTDTFDLANKLVSSLQEVQDTSGIFSITGTIKYYYNTLDQLEKVETYSLSNLQWLDTFIYGGPINLYSECISSAFYSGQLNPHYKTTRHFDTQNLPDTVNTYRYDTTAGWVQYDNSCWSYNTQGNPVKSYYTHPTWTVPATDSTFYYYEDYDPLTVKEAVKNLAFELYPNPADDMISVNLSENDPNGRIDLKIYNMEGRLVLREEIHNNTSAITVPVDQLSAGVYILEVLSDNGRMAGRKEFIKR